MLMIKDPRVNYGRVEVVKGTSFEIPEKSIATPIDANGTNKSTTLRFIIGLVKASGSSIQFDNAELLNMDTPGIMAKDIALVPEEWRVFLDMTMIKNTKIGACLRGDPLEDDINWVYDLFPRLKERSRQLTDALSGGEQQMLAATRALMNYPKLMMMDEPSLGLAPLIVQDIFNIIKKTNKQGVTIFLIEQNANIALRIADRGYVLETGRASLIGTGRELLADKSVKTAYLGKKKSNSDTD